MVIAFYAYGNPIVPLLGNLGRNNNRWDKYDGLEYPGTQDLCRPVWCNLKYTMTNDNHNQ
jgi:hypothetical protein